MPSLPVNLTVKLFSWKHCRSTGFSVRRAASPCLVILSPYCRAHLYLWKSIQNALRENMPLHSPVPQFPIAILNVPKLYYFFFLVIGIPLFCFKKKKKKYLPSSSWIMSQEYFADVCWRELRSPKELGGVGIVRMRSSLGKEPEWQMHSCFGSPGPSLHNKLGCARY